MQPGRAGRRDADRSRPGAAGRRRAGVGQPGLARRHHRHRRQPAGGAVWQADDPHRVAAGRGGARLGPFGGGGEHHRRAGRARRTAGQLRRAPDGRGLRHRPGAHPELRRALSRTVAAMQADAHVEIGLRIDGILPLAELTPALADDLGRLRRSAPATRR